MRLIDADKLMKDLDHEGFMAFVTLANSGTSGDEVYDKVIAYCEHLVEKINEQPTINVIEIEGRADIPCHVCDIYLEVLKLKEKIEHLQKKNAQYIETIQELKAKALSGWIPCSLGFEPEEDGLYLCTLDGELVGEDKPFVCSNDFYQGKWSDEECMIAWQPLPEPYRRNRND